MTKSLRDYITESEHWIDNPVQGDDFAINIREECLLESHIVDVREDAVIIEADDRMLEMLESYGLLGEEELEEEIRRYGAAASNSSQGFSIAEADQAPVDYRDQQQPQHITGEAAVTETPDSLKISRILELAGLPVREDEPIAAPQNANANDPLRGKAEDDAAVGPMEEREDREWSNRELEVLNKAERDFKRHLDSVSTPSDRAFNAELTKKRMATNPLAGPKGQLPEQQGVAEDYYVSTTRIAPNKYYLMSKDGKHLFGDPDSEAGYDDPMEFDSEKDLLTFFRYMQDRENFEPVMYNGKTLQYVNGQGVTEGRQDDVSEAEYRGRDVPLGKPMAGDVKKKKVYVRKPNGNVVKVEFGDKTMRIKKSNPKRRKSFRARHNCENPGPRWKARYWSCRAW